MRILLSRKNACTVVTILLGTSILFGQTPKKTSPGSKPASKMVARGAARAQFTPDQEAAFDAEKKNAVIVAPNYRDSGLASLRFTFNDAAELRSELERQGYTVHIVPGTEATSDGIREALTKEKTYLDGSNQATLLFAFMGHGFSDSTGKNYLMTYGADVSNMDKEALSVEEVEHLLNQSGARRKVILVDACRSVAGTRGGEKERTMAEFRAAEGMSILLATRPGAYSYEDPDLSHGVFTYFLLKGLRGEAAGADGFVTFADLSAFVQKNVSEYSERKDWPQKPLATMKDVGGDFLLATAAPAKPEDIKPIASAALVTSDTPILHALGSNLSFFVMENAGDLTLVDAMTGQPYAVLKEDPSKLGDAASKDAAGNLHRRWFTGNGPQGDRVDAVLEMHGSEMFRLAGRTGKACPTDRPCSQTPYPLLPGEVRAQATTTNKAIGKATETASNLKRLWGRSSDKLDKATGTSAVLDKTGVLADSRDKFIWTAFDLVSVPKPVQVASTEAKKP